jgi:hypothetical protein
MNDEKMFEQFLYYVRDELERIHNTDNDNGLNQIFNTLMTLEDFNASIENKKYGQVIDDLLYAARHFGYAEHKVYIPTVEELKAMLGEDLSAT